MNFFEFIVVFVSFMLLIGATAKQMQNVNTLAENSAMALEAKLEAEKCAAIVDSFYANAGGALKEMDFECHTENEKIVSAKNGVHKTSQTIAQEKTISGNGKQMTIQVKVRKHYEG